MRCSHGARSRGASRSSRRRVIYRFGGTPSTVAAPTFRLPMGFCGQPPSLEESAPRRRSGCVPHGASFPLASPGARSGGGPAVGRSRPRLQSPRSGAVSSVGRAPARQAGGHWFEPSTAHTRPAGDGGFFRVGAVARRTPERSLRDSVPARGAAEASTQSRAIGCKISLRTANETGKVKWRRLRQPSG
jgi:hypothetical protein